MCYAIPGKIVSIDSKTVTVDYFGEKRKAYNELSDLSTGDFVYAQGGYIINKVAPDEAESILALWKEEFFELQKVDLNISRLSLDDKALDKRFLSVLDKAAMDKEITRSDMSYLASAGDRQSVEFLYKTANFLRHKHLGNSCCVHAIIEISNNCKRSCGYCGISLHNGNLKRYRMSREEIVATAREAIEGYGFKAIVLQSGEDAGYSPDELCGVVKEIKEKYPALIFISFGETGIETLEKLYKSGARGLLMRFETSNPKLYEKLHPGQGYESRIMHLKKAYEMGYLVITGGLIGLPGQTGEDILNDIYLAKELNAEMFSFGPFIPHPETPLKSAPSGQDDIVKTLALARLWDRQNAKILVTTALETLDPAFRKKALLAGANSVMLNMTPLKYRPLYSIYPNRAHSEEVMDKQIDDVIALLRSLGRSPTDLSL